MILPSRLSASKRVFGRQEGKKRNLYKSRKILERKRGRGRKIVRCNTGVFSSTLEKGELAEASRVVQFARLGTNRLCVQFLVIENSGVGDDA